MPIRTGLDERISSVQKELKDYFEEARHVYSDAIDAFTKLDSEVYKEVKEVIKQITPQEVYKEEQILKHDISTCTMLLTFSSHRCFHK